MIQNLFTQVVDELSDDETPQRLQEYGIRMVTPPERLGVTYNWNLVMLGPTACACCYLFCAWDNFPQVAPTIGQSMAVHCKMVPDLW